MFRGKPSHPGWKLLLLTVSAAILIFWTANEMPCPFRRLTGIPCPGCGMSRAWLALLHGRVGEAFHWHPMFWAVPAAAVFALWDGRPFRKEAWNRAVGIGLAAGVGICWIVRLVLYFCGILSF